MQFVGTEISFLLKKMNIDFKFIFVVGLSFFKVKSEEAPKCEEEDYFRIFSHIDCSRFWQCFGGQAVLLKCPTGLYFNKNINICDWPENVDCSYNNSNNDNEQNGDTQNNNDDKINNNNEEDGDTQNRNNNKNKKDENTQIDNNKNKKQIKHIMNNNDNTSGEDEDTHNNNDDGNNEQDEDTQNDDDNNNEQDANRKNYNGKTKDRRNDNDNNEENRGTQNNNDAGNNNQQNEDTQNDGDNNKQQDVDRNNYNKNTEEQDEDRRNNNDNNNNEKNKETQNNNDDDNIEQDDDRQNNNDNNEGNYDLGQCEGIECPARDGGVIAHIFGPDCTKFCKCFHGVAYLQTCSPGLYFNSVSQVCDFPESSSCVQSDDLRENKEKDDTSNYIDKNNQEHNQPEQCDDVECPLQDSDSVLYKPGPDCTTFCKCYRGVAYLENCPADLYFNPTLAVCDFPDNSGCVNNNDKVPDEVDNRIPDEVINKIPDDVDNEEDGSNEVDDNDGIICLQPCIEEDGLYPASNCNNFCLCSNGEQHVMTCPSYLEFNAQDGFCDWPGNSGCRKNLL